MLKNKYDYHSTDESANDDYNIRGGEFNMEKKQFQAESKRLLELMINSIYTHKEVFLRELISNASDAIDKIYYKALTDDSLTFDQDNYYIKIDADKDNRLLTITDTGIGMTREEMENNLRSQEHTSELQSRGHLVC